MISNTTNPLSLLFGRRSVRAYAPGAIGEEAVRQLLEAAMAAPSAMTKDPWRFIVVRQPAVLAQMALTLPGGKMLGTCTLAIVVCGELNAAFESKLDYLLQDCSAATENLLLAAHGLGLGACWVGIHPVEIAVRAIRALFGLPTGILPLAAISLGYPGEQLEPRTRYQEAHVHLERW